MQKSFFGTLVFVCSFAVYAFTVPHRIYLEDNAEFITAGKVLGIAHPPGYPVYVILAKLFSYLPIGSLPFRINLLSGVFGSIGLAFFYLILRRIFAHLALEERFVDLVSALTALALGFSLIFWSQSIVAEVYTLNFFFLTLITWLFLGFTETKERKYFLWASFLFGLGFGNHQMLLLFLPILAIAFLYPPPPNTTGLPVDEGGTSKARENNAQLGFSGFRARLRAGMEGTRALAATLHHYKGLNYQAWIAGGLFFGFGLCVYTFLPIRSGQDPVLDWGVTHKNAEYFFYHVMRLGYGDLGGKFVLADKLKFFGDFFLQLWKQFSFGLILAGLGLLSLVKRSKKILLFSAGIFLANTLGIILPRALPFSGVSGDVYSVYYLPAYAVIVAWMGIGVLVVLSRVKFLAPAGLGLAAAALLIFNYPQNNLRNFTFLDRYSFQVLESLEPNAVLLLSLEGLNVDNVNFSLLYQKVVAGKRPDVTVVSLPNIFKTPDRPILTEIYRGLDLPQERRRLMEYALNKEEFKTRPLYATFPVENLSLDPGLASRSNGLVYRIYKAGDKPQPLKLIVLNPSERDEKILEREVFGQDFLASLDYTKAAWYAAVGDKGTSQNLLIEAIKWDNEPNGLDYSTYLLFRGKVLLTKDKQSAVSGAKIEKTN